MSSIQIEGVTKSFGGFTAVENMSLSINEGEFVALLGPSGCGKTTTMNMIAGFEQPTKGRILFDGKDLSRTRLQDRNIGFVFQNYATFTHLSVRRNLSFGLDVKNIPRSEIDTRVRAMADRMGISHRLDQPASSLSVNELQKLAIGRSAIVEPRIFLLDEPLSNLDAAFRSYMRSELKVLQHEFGQTMVYVTHDQIEAMSLADRIAVIDKGRLMQYGAPLDVYNNPQNRFVANFVGSPRINILDGKLVQESGELSLVANGATRIHLRGKIRKIFDTCAAMNDVSLAIRPHDIRFGPASNSEDATLNGTVEMVERVGPRRLVHLRVSSSTLIAFDERGILKQGDPVQFHFPSNSSIAFDLKTGERLGGKI